MEKNCKTKLPDKNLTFGIDVSRNGPQLSDSGNEFETCENTESKSRKVSKHTKNLPIASYT